MRVSISQKVVHGDLVREIEELSGEKLLNCYQCGCCSAGCPLSFAMDILPNQIIRLLQMGQVEEALAARTKWICATCLTCAARCPKGIDFAKIAEALRFVALREKIDHRGPANMPEELLKDMPQQGLISGFRKFST
jgi:heterodisulfide reductase subunit C